jgi:hypothetical protein
VSSSQPFSVQCHKLIKLPVMVPSGGRGNARRQLDRGR